MDTDGKNRCVQCEHGHAGERGSSRKDTKTRKKGFGRVRNRAGGETFFTGSVTQSRARSLNGHELESDATMGQFGEDMAHVGRKIP